MVDDEESIRDLVQRILQAEGYDVDTALNGEEALSKVEQSDIGVMMLDINMPKMSGIEVLQKITEVWPDICVMMLTAVDDLDTAVEVMKLGVYDYITKPFNKGDVIRKVKKAIEQRGLIAEEKSRADNAKQIWPTGLSTEDWVEKQDEVE